MWMSRANPRSMKFEVRMYMYVCECKLSVEPWGRDLSKYKQQLILAFMMGFYGFIVIPFANTFVSIVYKACCTEAKTRILLFLVFNSYVVLWQDKPSKIARCWVSQLRFRKAISTKNDTIPMPVTFQSGFSRQPGRPYEEAVLRRANE